MADSVFARIGLVGSIVLLLIGFMFTSGVFVGGLIAGISLIAIVAIATIGIASMVVGTIGLVLHGRTT